MFTLDNRLRNDITIVTCVYVTQGTSTFSWSAYGLSSLHFGVPQHTLDLYAICESISNEQE